MSSFFVAVYHQSLRLFQICCCKISQQSLQLLHGLETQLLLLYRDVCEALDESERQQFFRVSQDGRQGARFTVDYIAFSDEMDSIQREHVAQFLDGEIDEKEMYKCLLKTVMECWVALVQADINEITQEVHGNVHEMTRTVMRMHHQELMQLYREHWLLHLGILGEPYRSLLIRDRLYTI